MLSPLYISNTANTVFDAIITNFSSSDIAFSGSKILVDDLRVVLQNNSSTDINPDDLLYVDNNKHIIIPPVKPDISNSVIILQARKQ